MITLDHLEATGNAIIPPDATFEGPRFEAFKELATVSKKDGALIIAQVSHPGRQVASNIQQHPISASDVQLEANLGGLTFAKPRPATKEDIAGIIEGFAHAAEYLDKAGYDGINLHAAHGYLLAQVSTLQSRAHLDMLSLLSFCRRPRTSAPMSTEVR